MHYIIRDSQVVGDFYSLRLAKGIVIDGDEIVTCGRGRYDLDELRPDRRKLIGEYQESQHRQSGRAWAN